MVYLYTKNDFIHQVSWTAGETANKSEFDLCLQSKWLSLVDKGCFRYNLNILHSKIIPGNLSFLAQLNPDRALNRRLPAVITSLNQPFDQERFNFTKVKDDEILFEVKTEAISESESKDSHKDLLAINISPLEFGHCLLLPSCSACMPQVATIDSLKLAIELLLLSASPALRIGFNSLCGFATVNHLHYHVYYLQQHMLLEDIAVQQLSGPCYEITEFPTHGFVFQLPRDCDTAALASSVHNLTNYLQNENIAHNVYITRGKSFEHCVEDVDLQDSVRVYVWARKHSEGLKNIASFDPALCELFGHLVIKTEAAYESLTEVQVVDVLANTCQETFAQVRESVRQIFDKHK